MCGPWMIPLALMAGGAVAKYAGDQQAQQAQAAVSTAERNRQQEMSAKQDALFQKSVSGEKNIAGSDNTAAIDARKASYAQALNARPAGQEFLPGAADANAVVGQSAGKIVGAEHEMVNQSADAQARLNGLGDNLFKANISQGRDAQGVNQIGSAKMDSASVLPSELQAAAQKGGTLRALGGLASTIGSMWLAGGAGGIGAASSGAASGLANMAKGLVVT